MFCSEGCEGRGEEDRAKDDELLQKRSGDGNGARSWSGCGGKFFSRDDEAGGENGQACDGWPEFDG